MAIHALNGSLVLVLGTAALAIGTWSLPIGGGGGGGEPAQPDPPAPEDTATAALLIRAGLAPEALTAAGVSSQEASALVADAYAHLGGSPAGISAADTAYANAKASVDTLRRTVQSGVASPEQVSALATAKQTLAAAETARAAALDALFDAATADLSAQKKGKLETVLANKGWELPPAYLVVTHTQEDWVKLRDALANEKISAKYGQEPDGTCAAFLATCEANQTVAAALVAVESGCTSLTSAWNAALNQ